MLPSFRGYIPTNRGERRPVNVLRTIRELHPPPQDPFPLFPTYDSFLHWVNQEFILFCFEFPRAFSLSFFFLSFHCVLDSRKPFCSALYFFSPLYPKLWVLVVSDLIQSRDLSFPAESCGTAPLLLSHFYHKRILYSPHFAFTEFSLSISLFPSPVFFLLFARHRITVHTPCYF